MATRVSGPLVGLSRQDFAVGLSVLLRGTVRQRLEWAFNLYDLNKDGCVTKEVTPRGDAAEVAAVGGVCHPVPALSPPRRCCGSSSPFTPCWGAAPGPPCGTACPPSTWRSSSRWGCPLRVPSACPPGVTGDKGRPRDPLAVPAEDGQGRGRRGDPGRVPGHVSAGDERGGVGGIVTPVPATPCPSFNDTLGVTPAATAGRRGQRVTRRRPPGRTGTS